MPKLIKKNPRTASREIPRGVLTIKQTIVFANFSLILVLASAFFLNSLAFYLSFPVVILLVGYSYTKRFTYLCHIWLGICIGLAPLGVYIALDENFSPESWILFSILSTYISGFDILYSIQDKEFDEENKTLLNSCKIWDPWSSNYFCDITFVYNILFYTSSEICTVGLDILFFSSFNYFFNNRRTLDYRMGKEYKKRKDSYSLL